MAVFPPGSVKILRAFAIFSVTPTKRFCWGETFAVPISSPGDVALLNLGITFSGFRGGGFSTAYKSHAAALNYIVEEVYPAPHQLAGSGSIWFRGPLNVPLTAPEAAFRVQRVGEAGTPQKIGRFALPVWSDSWFLDLPHRRHPDTSILASTVAFWNANRILTNPFAHITYTPVIWDRKHHTATPVASYRVLPSTIRIWQRWKTRPTDTMFEWHHGQ